MALTDAQLETIDDAIDDALGRYATTHRGSDPLSSLGITGLNLYRVLKIIHDDLQAKHISFDMHALLVPEATAQAVEASAVDAFAGLVAAHCTSP